MHRPVTEMVVMILVLFLFTGCSNSRVSRPMPTSLRPVIDRWYVQGVNAANEDFKDSGPLTAMLLLPSAVMIGIGEGNLRSVGIAVGSATLARGVWGAAKTPETVPPNRLLGLTREERESFTRGYMDQLQERHDEKRALSAIAVGSSIVISGMVFLMYVSTLSFAIGV